MVVVCVVLLLTAAPQAFAQANSTTKVKAGYFTPKGSKAGFIFGGSYAWVVDEAVDIGIAVDFFRKNFTDETELAKTVDANKVTETEIVKNADFTTTILPVYGVINVKFPAGRYLDYVISGGLGYEWLWSKIQTYDGTDYNETKAYGGFKWLLSGGIVYQVGSRSSFLAEVFYDGTKVSREKKAEQGAPVRYEVDLSGIGFRVGVRMGFN